MRIGNLEIEIFPDGGTCWITKHYNDSISKKIELNEDEIYMLEFAVKEIKRRLQLN